MLYCEQSKPKCSMMMKQQLLNLLLFLIDVECLLASQQLKGAASYWDGHFMALVIIREPNKVKRLQWAKECFNNNDSFDDAIWSDETSVQHEFHQRHQFRKVSHPPKLKARPKHPVKVHFWAAIRKLGTT